MPKPSETFLPKQMGRTGDHTDGPHQCVSMMHAPRVESGSRGTLRSCSPHCRHTGYQKVNGIPSEWMEPPQAHPRAKRRGASHLSVTACIRAPAAAAAAATAAATGPRRCGQPPKVLGAGGLLHQLHGTPKRPRRSNQDAEMAGRVGSCSPLQRLQRRAQIDTPASSLLLATFPIHSRPTQPSCPLSVRTHVWELLPWRKDVDDDQRRVVLQSALGAHHSVDHLHGQLKRTERSTDGQRWEDRGARAASLS
jgi:hypothetical protein